MQAVAAGSATGNKHISHIHSTPVTVQMASPGREAGGAMKKDERSDRGENAEEERQREGRDDIFHGQLVQGNGEESGTLVVLSEGCLCLCSAEVSFL